jgi:hypothetical protein
MGGWSVSKVLKGLYSWSGFTIKINLARHFIVKMVFTQVH